MQLSSKITGERIVLKQLKATKKAAGDVFAAVDKSRATFAPWLGWVKHTTDPAHSLVYLKDAQKGWEEGTMFLYGLYSKEKNVFMGVVTATNVSYPHLKAEIAYWISDEFQGKGYMKEAVLLLEKELFGKGFNRLVIHTDILNERSAGLARACGYVHEGVLRQDVYSPVLKRYRDRNVFSKLKGDLK